MKKKELKKEFKRDAIVKKIKTKSERLVSLVGYDIISYERALKELNEIESLALSINLESFMPELNQLKQDVIDYYTNSQTK